MANFSLDDNKPPTPAPKKAPKKAASFDSPQERGTPAKGDDGINLDALKQYWLEDTTLESKLVLMLLGSDGVAKSGIALDYLTDEDIAAGKRAMIIDLDGGNVPLLIAHHKERVEAAGRKLSDAYLVKNPLAEDDEGNIDYEGTYRNVREAIYLAKHAWHDLNLKYVVFDGLSTALKHAENQMRVEKNLDADGGVQMRFWLVRNKLFLEMLEQLKGLPISSMFIAHEDFILKPLEDNSSVKEKANAMVHQKVLCERVEDKANKQIVFRATVTKSKYRADSEGSRFNICVVDKSGEGESTVTWGTKDLYEALL